MAPRTKIIPKNVFCVFVFFMNTIQLVVENLSIKPILGFEPRMYGVEKDRYQLVLPLKD